MDLFGKPKTFEELASELRFMAAELTSSNDLPERGIVVRGKSGTGKSNAGRLISCAICVNEPAYPATESDLKDENRTQTTLVLLKPSNAKRHGDSVECSLNPAVLDEVGLPACALRTDQWPAAGDDGKRKVRMDVADPELIPWLKRVVQRLIGNYESSADSFGCCGLFGECSAAGTCLHENRLYSTACAYRRHVERGEIFYGKEKGRDGCAPAVRANGTAEGDGHGIG